MPKMMDVADREGVKEWFRSYLDWLKTSEKGKAERDTLNNHAMCWALQAAEFAHVLDDTATREEVFRQYTSILLPNQLGPGRILSERVGADETVQLLHLQL
jgi:hypothetical protein